MIKQSLTNMRRFLSTWVSHEPQGLRFLTGLHNKHSTTKITTRLEARKSKLSGARVREADAILEEEALGIAGKRYTWEQLATEVGADVCGRSMRSTLEAALNFHKCLACVTPTQSSVVACSKVSLYVHRSGPLVWTFLYLRHRIATPQGLGGHRGLR